MRLRGGSISRNSVTVSCGSTETAVDANGVPTGNSVEVQLKYLVGSGRHSRTYLAELDGFLTESPLTWTPHPDHGVCLRGMIMGISRDLSVLWIPAV
jgi:hypothetical protein